MFGSDITIDFDGRRRCTLTFVNQTIPSPLGMHPFESVLDVWDIIQNPSSSSYCSMSPDVTGWRVAYYMHALLHAEALTMENLYEKLTYSQLQRLRINRFVRLYKDEGGNHRWGRMLASDDMCEILNDWLKKMPTPESAEAWQELSHLVGVGRRCIRHTDVYYTNATVDENATPKTPKSTVAPKLTRQKKRVYELLCRVTMGKVVPGRKMETNTFLNEIKNLTTKLEKEKKQASSNTNATSDPMRDA
eukprot:scaffold77349_cov32-Attheya_sp.AAC.1